MNLPVVIYGKIVDDQTRCEHYHTQRDVIAIRFKCCSNYYPCFQCHEETADHPAQIWLKSERETRAILCGVCKHELTIHEYLAGENKCPACTADFNPGCRLHHHLYFEL
jgi:uncharacterized CHY-type Zn-finger protein